MNSEVVLLLVALMFCHWAADFTHLSTDWMLNAKRYGKPLYPILMHAFVHSVLFFTAVYIITRNPESAFFAWWVELVSHFIIDVIKGKLQFIFRELEDPKNKFHWWLFGFDQFLHHLIIIFIAASIYLT